MRYFFDDEMGLQMKKLPETSLFSQPLSALKPVILALVALNLSAMVMPVNAGERESLEQLRSTTVNLVNLLVQEGVLSKGKADALLKQASQDAEKARQKDAVVAAESGETATGLATAIPADDKAVRVQYVPEIVKKEMRDEIRKEVMAKLNYKAGERLGLPDWIDRIVWEGDLRLRYQSDKFSDSNPLPINYNINNNTDLSNTTEDRDRTRLRARIGAKIKVNDWMTGGIRLTTGGLNDPISPNQTQEASSAKYTVGLDRAFLNAQITPWLNVVGGRFANPWFSTDLVWDPDLAFDGIASSLTPKFNDSWSGFATVGAFPLDENETSDTSKAKNKWMYGSQVGIKWTSPNQSSVKLGMALYEFDNVQGQTNGLVVNPGPFDGTVPAYRTKGNSTFDINNNQVLNGELFALTSKFRELNVTGQVDLATFDPVHLILTGDYVKNIGFDGQEIARRTGLITIPQKETDAYQIKLAIGMPTTYKAHDWQAFVAYKRLEADSVLDAYTDSDFFLGGTNAKGWIAGASYGVDKNAWLTARWFSADEISPRGNLAPLAIDVLMVDLNTKF